MSRIRALARGLTLLDLMVDAGVAGGEPRAFGVTEIAGELGIDKSSALRLALTLADHGYLQRDPVSRRYLLGPKMRHAVPGRSAAQVLREHARPFLFLLMKQTGECAHTALHADGHAVIIDDVESAASLRVSGGVGRLNLLHCTAVGKTLLAFADIDPPESLPRRTDRTLVDHHELGLDLERARRLGYAFDDVENEPGVRCLAAPVRDGSGRTIACIGISGPTVRMPLEQVPVLAAHVMDAARELSVALGHVAVTLPFGPAGAATTSMKEIR